MSFKLLTVTTELLTPDLCRLHQALPRVQGDRKIDQRRIDDLIFKARNGLLKAINWATCAWEGELYRVNGGHTSWLFSDQAGKEPIPHGLMVITEKYAAQTMEDVIQVWRAIDNQSSARNAAEQARTLQITLHPTLQKIAASSLLTLMAGLVRARTGKGFRMRINNEERITILREYEEDAVWLAEHFFLAYFDKERKIVNRSCVMSAITKTAWVSRDKSLIFWNLVLTGEAPSPKDPTRKLRELLIATKSGNTAGRMAGMLNDPELENACLWHWNRWRNGLEVDKQQPRHRYQETITPI